MIGNKINIKELENYKNDFHLEAKLINGTIYGNKYKDNKVSCTARVIEASNSEGEIRKGIINIDEDALWIELDSLEDWVIEATEL